jgi:hypothetical protein
VSALRNASTGWTGTGLHEARDLAAAMSAAVANPPQLVGRSRWRRRTGKATGARTRDENDMLSREPGVRWAPEDDDIHRTGHAMVLPDESLPTRSPSQSRGRRRTRFSRRLRTDRNHLLVDTVV